MKTTLYSGSNGIRQTQSTLAQGRAVWTLCLVTVCR